MPIISEQEQDTRRKHIVDSARELFITSGFIATNMEDVAKYAGIHRRTLYGYFKCKDELYYTVLNQFQKEKADFLIESIEQHQDEYDRLFAMGMAFYRYFEKQPEVLRFQLYLDYVDIKMQNLPEYIWKEYTSYNDKIIALLEDTIKKGEIRGKLARVEHIGSFLSAFFFSIRAVLNRCLLHQDNTAFLSDKSITPEEFYKNFITTYIKGIVKQ